MVDSKLVNILFLSTAFLFIFFASQTTGSLQKIIFEHEHSKNKHFHNSGFTGLTLFYFGFSATCWLVPPLLVVVGTKWALISGTITYLIFIAQFFHPMEWLLYIINMVLGAGSAIVYITQGSYIARNSVNEELISATRNSGILIAAQQASCLISAILMYVKYSNDDEFTDTDRYEIIAILTFICLIGLIMLFFLRSPPNNQSIHHLEYGTFDAAFMALKKNIILLLEPEILLLMVTFIYTGVVQPFHNTVYTPALMKTNDLDMEPIKASDLGYIFKGCGGLLGALTFAALGDLSIRWGRDVFVYMAGVFHLATFILIFLNIPSSSTFGQTNESSVIDPPNSAVAMTCSFLYGLGASFYTVHIYSMLAEQFVSDSAAAFTIYKFFQCLSSALSYFYSRFLNLHIQMVLLIVLLIAAVACFGVVERRLIVKENRKGGAEH